MSDDIWRIAREQAELLAGPGEVLTAEKLTEVWRRGYEQAITHLREDGGFALYHWARREDRVLEGIDAPGIAADYLTARLTEETTDD